MNTPSVRKTLLALAFVAASIAVAKADVAFSDLAATSPYYPGYPSGSAYQTWGSDFGAGSISYGSSFVSAATGNISAVTLGISRYSSFNGTLNLFLGIGAPDLPGSTMVALGSVTAGPVQDGSQLQTVLLNTNTSALLTAGQTYYLIEQPAAHDTYDFWWIDGNPNSPNNQSAIYKSLAGGAFEYIGTGAAPAYEVDVVPMAPTPPGWSLVTSPNTSATRGNYLQGVTCTSVSQCWAVGYYFNGSVQQTLYRAVGRDLVGNRHLAQHQRHAE